MKKSMVWRVLVLAMAAGLLMVMAAGCSAGKETAAEMAETQESTAAPESPETVTEESAAEEPSSATESPEETDETEETEPTETTEETDYAQAYSLAIEKYRAVYTDYAAADRNAGVSGEYGVSEFVDCGDHVGYALEDLDGNGIPEILIYGVDANEYSANVIYEACTLADGEPVMLFQSWSRCRYYLLDDGRIYNEGSNGAASSMFEIYDVVGAEFRFAEGYCTANDSDMSGEVMYHTVTAGEYGSGDYNNYDYTVAAEEGFALVEELENSCRTPELTTIA